MTNKKEAKTKRTTIQKLNKWLPLIFVFILVVIIKSITDFSRGNYSKSTPTPTPKPQETSEKIEVQGVMVNDFNKIAISIGELDDVLFVQKPLYNMTYYPLDKAFLIVITSRPFDDNRVLAEEEFQYLLGIDKNEACKLTAYITTPRIYNPEQAGINHTLSFCN